MAKRNTKSTDDERSIVSLALELRDGAKLDAWLDNHLVMRTIKTKAGDVQREMRRQIAVSSPMDAETLVAIVTEVADNVPGAVVDGDLTKGSMSRAIRVPLHVRYLGMTQDEAETWETDREREQSEARAALMSALAGNRAIVTKEDASMLAKIKARLADDPEFAEMFAAFDS